MPRRKTEPPAPRVIENYDGRDVIETTIAITNAGDGLSKSMATKPVTLHVGDEVYVVLKTTVTRIGYTRLGDTEVLSKGHTLRASTSTVIDFSTVAKVITEQERLNRLADEARRGVDPIPGTEHL